MKHHFSLQATGLLAAFRFCSGHSVSKFLGGVLLDKMRPEQAPVLFIIGGLLTALSVTGALMLSHQHRRCWPLFMLAADVFLRAAGAAIPAVLAASCARAEAVGSAYGIINGIG